ncbi:MAG: hypothetical protein AAF480_07080 [Actinomycetota bacterium]
MGEAIEDPGLTDETAQATRALARVVEPIHAVAYYTPEINGFRDDGFRGWWHAYMAYRPAPMGAVTAPTAIAALYNFAPAMVERAIPGVWELLAPTAVIARRDELVRAAFERLLADGRLDADVAEAAELARTACVGLPVEARPLFAAHAALPWPSDPAMALWHACTLLREFRGDNHNLVLAAHGVDGVECHVLMAAHGHGNQPTLEGIRGWTREEWRAAVERLGERGWVGADGAYTDAGRVARTAIERETDALTSVAVLDLGPHDTARLTSLGGTICEFLIASGAGAGVWPPPGVMKPDA